jgi:phospholipid/cholesterol/gamma-HCH transport system ATP-binding protein
MDITRASGALDAGSIPAGRACLLMSDGASTTNATTADIRFTGVQMAFGERTVFDGLDCHFPAGKISVILGGSGTGKSTLLRLIGGLITPQGGGIEVAGEDIVGASGAALRGIRERVAMLFQGGALLDSLTVRDNIALPLREHTRLAPEEIDARVTEALQGVGLGDLDGLLPGELSGGMLRRAALARAIVYRPQILLCDEPFSGLDPVSVHRIEKLLAQLNREHGITMLVVSHHIRSTLRMADHVLLFLGGRRSIQGPPQALLHNPEVAAFFAEAAPEAGATS